MKKKSFIGYVSRNWQKDFNQNWNVFGFPYTTKTKTQPMGDIAFDNIKVKITIKEV